MAKKPSKPPRRIEALDMEELLKSAPSLFDRHAAFSRGNAMALWDEIYLCAKDGKPLPGWVQYPLMEYLVSPDFQNQFLANHSGSKARLSVRNSDTWFCIKVFQMVNHHLNRRHPSLADARNAAKQNDFKDRCMVCYNKGAQYIFKSHSTPLSFTGACAHAADALQLNNWRSAARAYDRVASRKTHRLKSDVYASLISILSIISCG